MHTAEMVDELLDASTGSHKPESTADAMSIGFWIFYIFG
jgi:hypothetical protein